MSDISRFFKKNKIIKPNVFYAATKSLTDENGEPLKWEIKPLSSKENDAIQEQCTIEVPVRGKPNQYRHRIDNSKYIRKAITASVVYPDLLSTELQDSYKVISEEALITEMVNDAGEWAAFILFFNKFNGFSTLQEDVEEAKN